MNSAEMYHDATVRDLVDEVTFFQNMISALHLDPPESIEDLVHEVLDTTSLDTDGVTTEDVVRAMDE